MTYWNDIDDAADDDDDRFDDDWDDDPAGDGHRRSAAELPNSFDLDPADDGLGDDDDDDGTDTAPCPFCRRPVYESADVCPGCRNYIGSCGDPPAAGRRPWWLVVAALLCLAGMTAAYVVRLR